MSRLTFGKEIDMNLEGIPPNGSNLVAYHSGGGTFSNGEPMIQGMLLQKNSIGQITQIGAGYSGSSGISGTSGINGTSGSSGSSGINGTSGSSGSSGINGTSGSSGSSGINGTSGINGINGSSGVDGNFYGSSGSSGISGSGINTAALIVYDNLTMTSELLNTVTLAVSSHTIDKFNNLYVLTATETVNQLHIISEDKTILGINLEANATWIANGGGDPGKVLVDSKGNIYVSNSYCIFLVTKTGVITNVVPRCNLWPGITAPRLTTFYLGRNDELYLMSRTITSTSGPRTISKVIPIPGVVVNPKLLINFPTRYYNPYQNAISNDNYMTFFKQVDNLDTTFTNSLLKLNLDTGSIIEGLIPSNLFVTDIIIKPDNTMLARINANVYIITEPSSGVFNFTLIPSTTVITQGTRLVGDDNNNVYLDDYNTGLPNYLLNSKNELVSTNVFSQLGYRNYNSGYRDNKGRYIIQVNNNIYRVTISAKNSMTTNNTGQISLMTDNDIKLTNMFRVNDYQSKLIPGISIKTLNKINLLGSGDIQIGAIDNTTTSELSLSQLDIAYPSAVQGFHVQCLSIVGGIIIYEKTLLGWVKYSAAIVN